MKSYAAIDRIEGNYAVCEVELIETETSNSENYYEHEVKMVEFPVTLMEETGEIITENDILIVEHEDGCVSKVYGKSVEEKQRRETVYDQIMGN